MEQDPNKARLDSLSKRLGEIKKSQDAETARQRSERGSSKGVATGMRIVTELLAAILGSLLIGWFLDRMFGTSPWFLLVLLFLGMGAAFRNVWKIASVREDSGQDKDEG